MMIHPTAIIETGAKIASDVHIGPYCIIGNHVSIDSGSVLKSHVVIQGKTTIGKNNTFFPFSVIGEAPQSTSYKGEETTTIIGDNNTFREHVTVHRGTAQGLGYTRVGSYSYFMAASHIAHDCVVGDHVTFANNATIGGHVVIGDHAVLGGLCAVHQFVRIGQHAMIGGLAGVKYDIIPYGLVSPDDDKPCGLNLIGLKRRGFSQSQIQNLRQCYDILFNSKDSPFSERLQLVQERFAECDAVRILLHFIEAEAVRNLCIPH